MLKYIIMCMRMLSFQFQGAIQLASSLDRELESYYTFPILVRDGGIPERTAYAAVSLTGASNLFKTNYVVS